MRGFIKKLLREELEGKITYYNRHMDSYSDQHNYQLELSLNGELVGVTEYVLYDGEITISDIGVRPELRRQGLGSRMVKYIKNEFPEYQYVPSMKTDLGAKFKHKDLPLYENKFLNEAVSQFDYDSDDSSPTISWEVAKDNIDKSVNDISNEEDAKSYLNALNDKSDRLPTNIKKKLKKYAITALIGVIGLTSFNNLIGDMGNALDSKEIKVPSKKVDTNSLKTNIKDVVDTKFNTPNKVSSNLINMLKNHEGSAKRKGEPVLRAYELGDGKVTVGWGHAEPIKSSSFKKNQKIDIKTANELFKQDLSKAKATIDDILEDWENKGIEFDITQGMYDAMTSMTFNMGRQGFRNTEFIQLVKNGKYKEAKEKIKTTNVSYEGHKSRREDESNMFNIK